ncbi:MAG TPA: hypothetical protein VG123_31975 [Streptosporangiaceae bacterium]|nr:hypothetical protein [Streptosporangiaceae bacterium]
MPRLRYARCGVSYTLLPAFALVWRLDVVQTTARWSGRWWPAGVRGPPGGGAGGGAVCDRPRLGPPISWGSVRGGWRWSWAGQAVTPPARAGRFLLAAIGAAFAAAASLPGWGRLGAWRFASAVTGGRLIAANTVSPWYVVGRRRLMPPIPP